MKTNDTQAGGIKEKSFNGKNVFMNLINMFPIAFLSRELNVSTITIMRLKKGCNVHLPINNVLIFINKYSSTLKS